MWLASPSWLDFHCIYSAKVSMTKVSGISQARRWRGLLVAISLVAALAGSLGPLSLSSSTYAAPLVHATFLRTQQQTLQTAATDDPLPAPYAITTGRFRYFSQTAHFL